VKLTEVKGAWPAQFVCIVDALVGAPGVILGGSSYILNTKPVLDCQKKDSLGVQKLQETLQQLPVTVPLGALIYSRIFKQANCHDNIVRISKVNVV
jgi:hypothetical protein